MRNEAEGQSTEETLTPNPPPIAVQILPVQQSALLRHSSPWQRIWGDLDTTVADPMVTNRPKVVAKMIDVNLIVSVAMERHTYKNWLQKQDGEW